MNKLICILAMAIMAPGFTCDVSGITGIVEENSMYIPVGAKTDGGITEEQFHQTIDRVVEIYAPIIKELGGELEVERKWEDGTVNAYAQRLGDTWMVSMFGGLARHETITQDAFAAVICHEIGHHIGGAPKKSGWFGSVTWASNEGQADYFATSKCLRKYMENDNNIEIVAKMEVPKDVETHCSEIFTESNDVAICQRGAMAGLSLAELFRSLRGMREELSFTTPDTNVVRKTDHAHPAPQCRLDTYYQGSLCEISAYEDMDQRDPEVGACTRAKDYQYGLRPLCWYRPARSSEPTEPSEPDQLL